MTYRLFLNKLAQLGWQGFVPEMNHPYNITDVVTWTFLYWEFSDNPENKKRNTIVCEHFARK